MEDNFEYNTIIEEHRLLPPGGGWVFIKGNPNAPRGSKMPSFCQSLKIRHLDIYYAYNEIVNDSCLSRYEHCTRRLNLDSDSDKEEIIDNFRKAMNDPFIGTLSDQKTLLQISHPHQDRVCFYNGELSPVSSKSMDIFLSENTVKPMKFGEEHFNPITEEAIRDIVNAMELDGLSRSQAYNEAIVNGLLSEEDSVIPKMYYQLHEEYRSMFSDE